nr:MAG TPA: hypothetical protein [Caudoviricetes sp.]
MTEPFGYYCQKNSTSIKPRPEKSSRGFFMSFSEGMITSIFVKNVWR